MKIYAIMLIFWLCTVYACHIAFQYNVIVFFLDCCSKVEELKDEIEKVGLSAFYIYIFKYVQYIN